MVPYLPVIAVLVIGITGLSVMLAKGCYEFGHGIHGGRYANRMNANLYPVIWEVIDGPHKGRRGKCVSYYAFDYWVTLNVEMIQEELWNAWRETQHEDRGNGVWRPDDWFKSVGGKRTWITVRKNQVAATDLDESPPAFGWRDASNRSISLAGDYQAIGYRNGLKLGPFSFLGPPIPKVYREFYDRGFYCGTKDRELFDSQPDLDRRKAWGHLKCGEWIRVMEYYAEQKRQAELESLDPGPFYEPAQL